MKGELKNIPLRYIIAILLTVIEITLILLAVIFACYKFPLIYALAILVQIFCVIKIVSSNDNPDYKVSWLIVVLVIPIIGYTLYFMFYSRKLKPHFVKRLNKIKVNCYTKNDDANFLALKNKDKTAYSQAKLLTNLSGCSLYRNTSQKYFSSGESFLESYISDLKTAKNFIFMEYFIIKEGVFWNSVLEILKEKLKSGVEVYIVFDDIGCMKTLSNAYIKNLSKLGLKITPFSRLKVKVNSEFNNRSHRKITVIDGKIAYLGGINISDEYCNLKSPFGYWKDSALRLEGDGVKTLTSLFLFDYGSNIKFPLKFPNNAYPKTEIIDNGFLIPFGDGPKPLYEKRVSKTLIQTMLSVSTEYAYITTPYLIIDSELCKSIENTALRGVEVRLFLPAIPDKKLIHLISKSCYDTLLNAGVKIYEFSPGFMHAKTFLIDGKYALLGSINLDYRSLAHHFENGVWLYDCDCIKDIKTDLDLIFNQSKEIKKGELKLTLPKRILCSIIKIFAPLL